jgi:hypothetical protein
METVVAFVPDFAHELSLEPNVTVRCSWLKTLTLFGEAIEMLPEKEVIELHYDTSFNVGNYYISALSVR